MKISPVFVLVLLVWVHRILSPDQPNQRLAHGAIKLAPRGKMNAGENRTKQKSNQPTREIEDATDEICKHRSHRFEGGKNGGEDRAEDAENGVDEILQRGD